MERSEIAETICEVLFAGKVAASLASVANDKAEWVLVSGTSGQQPSSDSSQSGKYFQGFAGLSGLANFCSSVLQTRSGDLTGCVIRGDCLFLFGMIRLQTARNKKPVETNFAGKLIWQGNQVASGEFRIMWPFPPDQQFSSSDRVDQAGNLKLN